MPNLTNLTPFAAADFPSIDKRGEERLVVVVAASFVLPPPGRPASGPLQPCEQQPPPAATDVYWGEPGQSSLRYENQAAYVREKTDVVVHGHAWAPRGRPATKSMVSVRVGPASKRAVVLGPRVWRQGAGWLTASSPEPFESIRLSWEHAFGGSGKSTFEPRNPLGMGFYESDRDAIDKPLPFVEDPGALLQRASDRPPPCAFGPVPRSFQPRLALAGTYDPAWIEARAPLWPDDFDEAFFQSAPAGLVVPHLSGGEPIVLEGLSPDGPIACALPEERLVARCAFAGRAERKRMTLDTVSIEPDERRIMLVWRASFPAHRALATHVETIVRALLPWEDAA